MQFTTMKKNEKKNYLAFSRWKDAKKPTLEI